MKPIKISDKNNQWMAHILSRRRCRGTFLKSLLSGGGMHHTGLPVIPLFLIHFASMFPEVFVALDVQFYKVADFDWVDFSSAAVADLRQ